MSYCCEETHDKGIFNAFNWGLAQIQRLHHYQHGGGHGITHDVRAVAETYIICQVGF